MNRRLGAAVLSTLLTLACSRTPAPAVPARPPVARPAPAGAALASLQQRIATLLADPAVAGGTWGIEARSLRTNETLIASNAHRLLTPASTLKTITLAAAADQLGWDYTYDTRAVPTGRIVDGVLDGDLVLVASGDPNLSGRERPDGSYAFIDQDHSYGGQPLPTDPLTVVRDMARQVAARGIKDVTGQVIVDASLFPEAGRRSLEEGVTDLAILLRSDATPDPTPPRTKREWFDRHYEVVTPGTR